MALLQSLLSKQLQRSRLLTLGLSAALLGPGLAFGQTNGIKAENPNTTATTINLSSNVAIVGGGQQAGDNLYHRFSEFDTTKDNLNQVLFNLSNGTQNLVVGVSSTSGSIISVPIVLSQSANLIFMSPYGIVLTGGAGFGFDSGNGLISPLPNLTLTTANKLDFTNNATTASNFEVKPISNNNGFPTGSPNTQVSGLHPSFGNLGGKIILDGTQGAVSLVVDQSLLIAELNTQSGTGLSPVQVKGEVSLGTSNTGTIDGAFNLGEWSNINNSWNTATLIATSTSGTLTWLAPVAVKPGSDFNLQATGNGSITLNGLVSLFGWETPNTITFASLVSTSGNNTVAGGIELFGPGRIEVIADTLQINDAINSGSAITANYTNNNPAANHWGAPYDAYNLLFDIALTGDAIVDGAIILGDGGVTKVGDGTLTLNSLNNAYTGPTNVLGGYLQVNGPVPDSANCSNGGDSNLCSGQDYEDDWLAEYYSFDDGDLSLDVNDGNFDSFDGWAMDESSDYDMASGEGSFTAPGLDVDLAVNNSFSLSDSKEQGAAPTSAGQAPGSAVSSVGSQEAGVALSRSDNQATLSTLQNLAPEQLGGGIPSTPTPQQLQVDMQRQVQQIQSGTGGFSTGQLRSQRDDESNWIASTNLIAVGPALPSFQRSSYQPAVVHIRFSEERAPSATTRSKGTDAFLDITLIPLDGPVEGRRVEVSKKLFMQQLRELYSSLSRQDPLDPANPKTAARQLFDQLIGPIEPVLKARRVTTLLIAADRGLQAIPFAALHDGSQYFGERYGFSITPSLANARPFSPHCPLN